MNMIHLIGIDSSSLTADKMEIIRSCPAIFGAERFLERIAPKMAPAATLLPISPVAEALSRIEGLLAAADVAVLAGGDPLFFGIGKLLLQRFGARQVRIYPAVSSMQMAFARFKIPWDDAHFVSVHGRGMDGLLARIAGLPKVFLLTDAQHSPAAVAASLLKGIGETEAAACTVHVAENLGEPQERLTTAGLHEIAKGDFSALSVMILIRRTGAGQDGVCRFGLRENEIIHSRGLITKSEVRAATLHALRLPDTGVFWDVGAGSGSVSLEAARMFPRLQVFAVEAKTEQIANIMANRDGFKTHSLTVINGSAPEVFADLPSPDRIFVGGSGGRLQDILGQGGERLKPGGILVVNSVIETTLEAAPAILHRMGFAVSIATISVRRCNYPENRYTVFNPIHVITGCKPGLTGGAAR